MNFLISTAVEVAPIEIRDLETPSLLDTPGAKGEGEAGAIEDAPRGVRMLEMPLNPRRLRAPTAAAPAEGSP